MWKERVKVRISMSQRDIELLGVRTPTTGETAVFH